MALPNPNRLVVEDVDLEGVVIGLMKHHVEWGTSEPGWPVYIQQKSGKKNVFKPKETKVEIKASGVQRFGIVVDADTSLKATWDAVSHFCRELGGKPPKICPPEGLILPLSEKTFGAWIMPNNKMEGMVEDLCHGLVPAASEPLWKFALQCAEDALKKKAPFSKGHMAKAHIHTWLAWQDPPGERMGKAITDGALEHASDDAKAFVKWFITLFDLKPKAAVP